MSRVINKRTLQYLESVHTPDYSKKDWLINPKLPKCAKKYWRIKDNKVLATTKTEKAKVDRELMKKVEVLKRVNTREKLIQDRIRKIAKDQLVKEGIIKEDRNKYREISKL